MRRLELLAVRLKDGMPCTIDDLAQEHQVSRRTIARDLSLMRDQGLPVDADRGRGGGVRLDRHWGIGRMNLSYAEAVDLLISIAVAEQMKSPLFLANLGSVRRQLEASFSPEKRDMIHRLKSRILIGATASHFVQAGAHAPPTRVVQAVHQGFVAREQIVISYRSETGERTERRIEPHYLLLKYPIWYVIAFDHLRQAPRSFRCDRIESAQRTSAPFNLLPKTAFQSCLVRDDLWHPAMAEDKAKDEMPSAD